MTIAEANHILRGYIPAIPNVDVRYAGYVVDYALSQNLEQPWHPCRYEDLELKHDGSWKPGRWYEWLDKYNNREVARMKDDAADHFWPETKIIKKEDVIAFRETLYNTLKRRVKETGIEISDDCWDVDL